MCRQEPRVRMSAEEEIAAEESLSVYCKPVEFYNILQRRAIRNPSFLQRCLSYKIEAKHKRRIQMTVSLSGAENDGARAQSVFPLYVFLARLVSDVSNAEYSAVYRFNRACMLTNPNVFEGRNQVQASFVLPDINKLASEVKSGSISILLVSFVGVQNSVGGTNLSNGAFDMASFPTKLGGYCLWGKIPLESLYISWENSPNFSLGQRAEMMSTIDMQSCFLKLSCSNEEKCISIDVPYNIETVSTSQQVQVTVSAEQFGAKEKSPYNSYICNDVPSSSLSHIIRLRAGNVIFNYRYYNNKLQRTEGALFNKPKRKLKTEKEFQFFLRSIMPVKGAGFSGSFQDLKILCWGVQWCPLLMISMNFSRSEMYVLVTEDYQAVNVSVKIDNGRSEILADGVDPKLQVFLFYSKPLKRKRRKSLVHSAKHVHPYALESDLRGGVYELMDKADDAQSSKGEKNRISGVSDALPLSNADHGCVQSTSGNNLAPPTLLQFAKTRKLSVERSDPRKCVFLSSV
ncbi:hypothetical protein TIFTF001_026899 [Ficus carica]|uniref:DUF7651 domain-containing protein n=1 Tax=Ficus carica TaxID=3494 RepID=A0AA88IU88_FICCA|nr:hypothetical protein TIFTF001_026899 [Ficus carica]